MVDPQVKIKANYNRTVLTVRISAITSPDWTDIVGTKVEFFRKNTNGVYSEKFYTKTSTHYKVRAYLENLDPNWTFYGKVTLTKSDNTTHESTFSFISPYPLLGTVIDGEGNTRYIVSLRKMDKNGNLSPRNYTNTAVISAPPYIDIMADASGSMVIGNQWTTPISVQNITQDTTPQTVAANATVTLQVNTNDILRVVETQEGTTFRTFASNNTPLCAGVSAHIVRMPAMNKFTMTGSGINMKYVNSQFFRAFNRNGSLTSLPEGSFDTRIIEGGSLTGFFYNFNQNGALTSLPEGSFDTSNILGTYGTSYEYVFTNFNSGGALTSLPEGSFDFDNLRSEFSRNAFDCFNYNGALTSLPEGSFGFTSAQVSSDSFAMHFDQFNNYGALTSLPAGAFHFPEGSSRACSFNRFNQNGALTSLPEHSFNFLIRPGTFTFQYFNSYGALTSLPAGSFRFDPTWKNSASSAFAYFNQRGALTTLPAGSFNTDNFTTLSQLAFKSFNSGGALTSLPTGSFNFDNVTIANDREHFQYFNYQGALTTLPKGSFSFPNLTTVGNYFAYAFNEGGALEYLPVNAFSVNNVTSYGTATQPFVSFNYNNGKLTKSDTDYNPDFIALNSNVAYYYDPSTQTQYYESISNGNPFKYREADYFSVTYTQSATYTTDIGSSYLSGTSVTFAASATDEDYGVAPSIQTDGGTTVTVTDNGNGTFTFTMPKNNITVNFALVPRPATITLVAEEAGTMIVYNKWNSSSVIVESGGISTTVAAGSSTNIAVDVDDEVTVTESVANNTFRIWRESYNHPLASGVLCRISKMPKMERFYYNGQPNGYMFHRFCMGENGKGITSLPDGSFDTSGWTQTQRHYTFNGFNFNGLLTSLPAGSFNTSNVTKLGQNDFSNFNNGGALTSLPAGSFNFDNLTICANNSHFQNFNNGGALTSLPAGSFSFRNLSSLPSRFCENFNRNGALTSLPAGSFNTSNTVSRGIYVLDSFNNGGALTSLPAGSFDMSSQDRTSNGLIGNNFNGNNGQLTKSTVPGEFNPNMINPSSSTNVTAHYADGTSATIAPGEPYYFKTT